MPFDADHQPAKPDYWFDQATFIVLGQQARRDQALRSVSGVRWSGMDPIIPTVQTVEAVALDLERKAADRAAFQLTPAGRFYRAAYLIAVATGDCRLLDCADRGLASNGDRAAKLLAACEGPAADEATAALTDFLAEQVAA